MSDGTTHMTKKYPSRHERGYGSAWDKIRPAILQRDMFLCQECKRQGRLTPAKDVDHKIPKAQGGTDNPDNLQSLCRPCHKAKTRDENRSQRRGAVDADGYRIAARQPYSIPDGVKPSGIPVVLVSGPPASGKSTYVNAHAKDGDTVIDFDECRKKVGGRKWDARKHIFTAAYKLRDALIHSLADKTSGTAYLIVTAPSQAERIAWTEALGDVTHVVIRTPAGECIERIKADPDRAEAAESQIQAVHNWWRND